MNKKLIFKILGIILGIEGVSLLIPFVIALDTMEVHCRLCYVSFHFIIS